MAATGSITPTPTPSDDEIAGLVARYGRLLYRVAFSITHDAGLAEDVVQETLLKALTSMPSWEGDTPIRWMRRVCRNQAINVMRQSWRNTESDWDAMISNHADTERVVENRHLVEATREALSRLDAESRTLIVMRETDELSYEEIAELMDMTPSAVKAKLYRARHAMKTHLRDWTSE